MKRFKHADKHTVLKKILIINMECVWSHVSLKQREHQPYSTLGAHNITKCIKNIQLSDTL